MIGGEKARPRLGWAAWLGGVGVLLTGLSVWVGFASAHHPEAFNWEVAAIFGTAVGTLALAVATGALALSSRQDVRATKELADLAREDQGLRDRPQVVLHVAYIQTLGSSTAERRLMLSVDVRNVGLGPALDLRVHARQKGEPLNLAIGSFLLPVIAPGAPGRAELPISFVPGGAMSLDDGSTVAVLEGQGFDVYGDCTDRKQMQRYPVINQWGSAGPIPPPEV